MRNKIFCVISASGERNKFSSAYDFFMIIVITLSIIPLMLKQSIPIFEVTEKICAFIFVIDYLLRWITADYMFEKKSITSFFRYPFSVMAIIDLISILPTITALNKGLKLLRLLRMLRALRVFRTFKLIRYSKNATIIINVFKKQKKPLSYVLFLAIAYILISALIVFNVEPDSFGSFFDAIYWATVSLTTMGYGDIYPVTTIGRIVTMASSILGIAIVALPAGIITAGYMEEISFLSDKQYKKSEEEANK